MIRRPMRSATRGADPRVEVGGDVEREVAWAGASGRVAVGAAEEVAVLGWRLLPAAGDGFRRVIGCGARMAVINRRAGCPR